MLRIAVQSKGRLFEDTMNLLNEADIKVSANKRTLLVKSSDFPLEVLYLRDDDIPQCVASGVADIGVVGENEFTERGEDAEIISRLGFSKCRLSLGCVCAFLDIFIQRDLKNGTLTEQEAQELIDQMIMKLRIVRFLRTHDPTTWRHHPGP